MDRYTVISADCHAGADLFDYREYLEAKYQDEFDDWAKTFVNPFGDLSEPDAEHNWDSDRRNAELDSDGVAGEVIFPNTVPPFFPQGSLAAPAPSTARDLELRWAGLRAHNRWLADFCSLSPERRAGWARSCSGTSTRPSPKWHRSPSWGCPAACCCPGLPPAPASPRCMPSTGSRSGRRARRRAW